MQEGTPKGIPRQEKKKETEPDFEITPERKRDLGNAWVEMIVDTEIPEGIENFDNEKLREWLFESIVEGVDGFVDKEGIKADEYLIEEIGKEKDLKKRSELEMQYIQSLQKSIGNFMEGVKERGQKTKWNSWPKLMEETRSFNCAGAALIGISFLEKAGIKSKVGFPVNHVVNIVELSDGSIIYADLANTNTVHEIDPEILEVEGTKVLKFEDKHIEYQTVPVFDNQMIISAVLGNLDSIEHTEGKKITDLENKKRAKEYLNKFKEHFVKVGFGELDKGLCKEFFPVDASQIMKDERERISIVQIPREAVSSYMGNLEEDIRTKLKKEIREQKEMVEGSIKNRNYNLPDGTSGELRELINVIRESLDDVEERHGDAYKNSINYLVRIIRSV